MSAPLSDLVTLVQNQEEHLHRLEESLAQRVLSLEDIGWTPLQGG